MLLLPPPATSRIYGSGSFRIQARPMPYEIVVAPEAMGDMRGLTA